MERAAKLTLMFSLSLFLLAASRHLFGGELPSPREAHAQTFSGLYPGPEVVHFTHDSVNQGWLVDVDGYIWTFTTGSGLGIDTRWERGDQIFPSGMPVPTGSSSITGLKDRFQGN